MLGSAVAQTSGPAPVAPGRGPARGREAPAISLNLNRIAGDSAGFHRLIFFLFLILIFEKFLKSFRKVSEKFPKSFRNFSQFGKRGDSLQPQLGFFRVFWWVGARLALCLGSGSYFAHASYVLALLAGLWLFCSATLSGLWCFRSFVGSWLSGRRGRPLAAGHRRPGAGSVGIFCRFFWDSVAEFSGFFADTHARQRFARYAYASSAWVQLLHSFHTGLTQLGIVVLHSHFLGVFHPLSVATVGFSARERAKKSAICSVVRAKKRPKNGCAKLQNQSDAKPVQKLCKSFTP